MLSGTTSHYLLDGEVPETPSAAPWRPAIIVAVGSSLVSVALAAVAVQAAGVAGSLGATVRAAVQTWLVAVGATFTAGDLRLDLVPVGATFVVVVIVLAVTRLALRSPVADPIAFGAMAGGIAGLTAAVCSAATSNDAHGTSFVRAAFGAFVVVGLAAAWGAARRGDVAWLGLPARWTPIADGASSGVTLVLGGATVLTLVLALRHLGRAADLWATLDPGGPVLLGLMCVVAFPTLVLWSAAVLLGPGFAIGADTSVDLTGSALGNLPGFPPLAGLPDPGPFPSTAIALMLIPLLAGLGAGVVAHARTPTADRDWRRTLIDGAAAGAAAGLVLGLLVETARGSLGPGDLAVVGPPGWQTLLVAVPLLAAGGACGAAADHYRSGRDRPAS